MAQLQMGFAYESPQVSDPILYVSTIFRHGGKRETAVAFVQTLNPADAFRRVWSGTFPETVSAFRVLAIHDDAGSAIAFHANLAKQLKAGGVKASVKGPSYRAYSRIREKFAQLPSTSH